MSVASSAFPFFIFGFGFCLAIFVLYTIISGQRQAEVDDQTAREDRLRQQALDTAIRGADLDLKRLKAGLQPLGFENSPVLVKFVAPAAVAPAAQQPAVPHIAAPQQPAAQSPEAIPVGEVLEEDDTLPVPEVNVLIPERILSISLAPGVHGIIGFYAGETVAVRSIQVSDPQRFGLPAAEYAAGSVTLDGRTEDELLADATALLPGVFLRVLTDPATEQALRIRAA